MKVQITDDSKKVITVAQMKTVREIIRDFKDDETSVEEYVKYAIHGLCGDYGTVEILKCSAEIARNCRVWNSFSDNSEDLDIWIKGTSFFNDEFVIIEAYLSDIWNIDSNNRKEIANYFYVRRFREVKGGE